MDLVLLPMERAEQSFRDWLEATADDPGVEGRLEEGLVLLRQACRGVEALHAEGLAHMDLKPENLLLMEEGDAPSEETEWTVKIGDFGLARSLRRGEVLNEEVVAEGIGTPYYMAPEQIRAARQKEVGKEADIYSLGVMLFELIDGDRPFDGPAERVREKHLEMDPPEVHTEVPGRLEEVAHACLQKEAGERPQIGKLTHELNSDGEVASEAEVSEEGGAGAREAASAEPDEATRRRVRRALEQENLQPVEESLGEGTPEVRAALEEEAETLDESRQGALLRQAAEEDLPAVARALLAAGTAPNALDEEGKAPLHWAAEEGAVEVAEALLEEWADPNLETEKGQTPLHYVASSDEGETLMNMLLEAGADANATDEKGKTPLHRAVKEDHLEVVELLVEAGADPDAADEDGKTPLHQAAWLGHPGVAKVLIDRGADLAARTDRYGFIGTQDMEKFTPLHGAAFRGNEELTEILLKAGCDVSDRVQGGELAESTPLHLSFEDGVKSNSSSKVAALLIESGAEVDATRTGRLPSSGGFTPLHRAALNGHVEGAEVLIQAGAAVDATDEKGQTPLHKAASGDHSEVPKVLIDAGASVDLSDEKEQTPLHRAAELGCPEVAGLLLDAGAEVNATTRFKYQTPLDKSEQGSEVARRIRREGGKRAEDLSSGGSSGGSSVAGPSRFNLDIDI